MVEASAPSERKPLFRVVGCWLLLIAAAICAAIAIPGMSPPSRRGRANQAAGALKWIATKQEEFKAGDKDHNDVEDYAPDLRTLRKADLIDEGLATGRRGLYVFEVTTSKDRKSWSATAAPGKPEPGDVWLFVDATGVVRAEADKPATASSEELGSWSRNHPR